MLVSESTLHQTQKTAQRQISRRNPSDIAGAAGATMLETALIIPIFLALIIVLIDYGHILAVQQVLNFGAIQGAQYAAKLPDLGLDFRQCSDPQIDGNPACDDATQDQNASKYRQALAAVERAAMDLPLKSLLTNNTDSDQKNSDPSDSVASTAEITSVEFIRPGDKNHPLDECKPMTTPPLESYSNDAEPYWDPPGFNGYAAMRVKCPLRVEMKAKAVSFFMHREVQLDTAADAFGELSVSVSRSPAAGQSSGTVVSTTTTTTG